MEQFTKYEATDGAAVYVAPAEEMTLAEIVRAANDAIGAAGVDCVDVLAPWVVMNAHYEAFHDWVEKLGGRHLLAKYANNWTETYRKFNHKLFRFLPEDLAVELVERLMDDFARTLDGYFFRVRSAVREQVKSEDVELKTRVAHVYVCYELAIIAQTMFGRVVSQEHPARFVPDYDEVTGETKVVKLPSFRAPAKAQDLDQCATFAMKWLAEYIKQNGVPPVLRSEAIENAERELCRAAVRWIGKINTEIKENGKTN